LFALFFYALSPLNRFGFAPEFPLPIQAVSSFLLGNIGDVYRFLRFKKKSDAKGRVETQQKELNARGWRLKSA